MSKRVQEVIFDARKDAAEVLLEKLADASTPGYQVEFDPEEAECAGAFVEDAISEADAMDSCADLLDAEIAHG